MDKKRKQKRKPQDPARESQPSRTGSSDGLLGVKSIMECWTGEIPNRLEWNKAFHPRGSMKKNAGGRMFTNGGGPERKSKKRLSLSCA